MLSCKQISRPNLQRQRTKVVPQNFFVFEARAALETIETKTILITILVTGVEA